MEDLDLEQDSIEQATEDVAPQEQGKESLPEATHTIRWGKEDRALTYDQLKNYAQQGYDYSTKMRDYNVQRNLWEQERKGHAEKLNSLKSLEEKLKLYQEVEEYQKKDPNWWPHVVQSYQSRGKEQGQAAPDPVVQKLMQTVEGLSEKVQTQEQKELALKQAQEDAALDEEIQGYKQQFTDFDWTALDEQGLDLERRILKHANDNKIQSFRVAARDYLFDEHMKRGEIKAKENLGKNLQKINKMGLGPLKDTPKKQVKEVKNIRGKSWDELADEGIQELRA